MKTLLSRHMLCTSQFEASTFPPPGLACSNSLPSGQKSRLNAPPISTEKPLLKDKFRLQRNTVHTFQREICGGNTFKLSYSLTKAKFYLVNPSNLAKDRKSQGNITPEQEINPVQIPRPGKATFKFPPSRAQWTVKCPRYARGDVEASI